MRIEDIEIDLIDITQGRRVRGPEMGRGRLPPTWSARPSINRSRWFEGGDALFPADRGLHRSMPGRHSRPRFT